MNQILLKPNLDPAFKPLEKLIGTWKSKPTARLSAAVGMRSTAERLARTAMFLKVAGDQMTAEMAACLSVLRHH